MIHWSVISQCQLEYTIIAVIITELSEYHSTFESCIYLKYGSDFSKYAVCRVYIRNFEFLNKNLTN
jgi:hypothetical protein